MNHDPHYQVDIMNNLYWFIESQMARLQPYFPKMRGKPRVDDPRVLRDIIFINRNGLRKFDLPREYGPHKTLNNAKCGGLSSY